MHRCIDLYHYKNPNLHFLKLGVSKGSLQNFRRDSRHVGKHYYIGKHGA